MKTSVGSSVRPSRATRDALASRALRLALKTRQTLQLPLHEAVCVYDAAEALGVEVRFDDIASMEGMYVKRTARGVAPHIVVCSVRPTGRQAMTAAHELGHHAFGHGTRIDQYVKGVGTVGSALAAPTSASTSAFDPDEFLADAFGAFFLMPKSAVDRGLSARGIAVTTATPLELYRVAGWLGVGYSTLVYHMCLSLKLISWPRAQQLLAAKPKALREQIVGEPIMGDVYVVDAAWTGRPVDLKIGDVALVPRGTVMEPIASARAGPGTITETSRGLTIFEAGATGLGRLTGENLTAFVRVAEREYSGRNLYRHLEATQDEDDE